MPSVAEGSAITLVCLAPQMAFAKVVPLVECLLLRLLLLDLSRKCVGAGFKELSPRGIHSEEGSFVQAKSASINMPIVGRIFGTIGALL